jgi:UDP-N-acetyl-2-amino-2-deoxyglucuronate dehydrogenase
MAISLEAADRILAAERASGRKVAVVSQHRFDGSTEKVIAAIQAGDLGRLTSGIASTAWWRGQSYYDAGRWRGTWAMDGGGAIMNQTIHTIDLLVAMMGVPTEVFACTACLAHERVEVEDTAVAVMRFGSGALGIIHGTTAADALTVGQHRLGAAHVAQFADFVEAIRSDRPVRVGTREARAVLAVVLSLYASADSGQPVLIENA